MSSVAASSSQTLTFDDEFSNFEAIKWATVLPFWGAERTLLGNHESEYYVDASQSNSPFSNADGILTISATPTSSTGANPLGLPYNSGVITTYNSFSQLYGKFEVRAKLPSGAGLWPAFWLMPTDLKAGPELDIFEVLGDHTNVLYSTVHSRNPTQESLQVLGVPDTSVGFHTYAVDWGPSKIVLSVDGQVVSTATTPADMNVPMYMILNLAVGGSGSWPGAPSSNTVFPAAMQIDYVRVEQTANTVGWTDSTPSQPAPLMLPAIQDALKPGTAFAYVFVEHFGNGDGGTPISGVGVALLNSVGRIIATGTTDTTGVYTFGGLPAGTYSIRYVTPASLYIKAGNFADAKTGVTGSFTLSDGQGYGVPFQFVSSSAELAGDVQLASHGVPNITVDLLDSNQTFIKSTKTDSAGHFSFWTQSGQYYAHYNAPSGTTLAVGGLANSTTGLTALISLADQQAFLLVPEQISASATLNPSIKTVTGNRDGGITLTGSSAGGNVVTVSDSVNGATNVLGTVVTAANGVWSVTSHAKISMASVHSFGAFAQDNGGHAGNTAGQFLLASNGSDIMNGTSGKSDIYAIMSFKGADVINNFETSSSAGSVHDYINLSGRGISSFSQVQALLSGTTSAVLTLTSEKTITLTNVTPSSLTAADFRYS